MSDDNDHQMLQPFVENFYFLINKFVSNKLTFSVCRMGSAVVCDVRERVGVFNEIVYENIHIINIVDLFRKLHRHLEQKGNKF